MEWGDQFFVKPGWLAKPAIAFSKKPDKNTRSRRIFMKSYRFTILIATLIFPLLSKIRLFLPNLSGIRFHFTFI